MRITRVTCSWKEAATVMMFAKNVSMGNQFVTGQSQSQKFKQSNFDYRLLMLERSSKSKFMPSAYVFPGGGISQADYCSDWLDLYKQTGISNVNSSISVPKQNSNRAPMFTISRDWPICSDVAFRICSIRETFEEAGILLCKHRDDVKDGNTEGWKAIDKWILQEWRPLIQKDASKFVDMCEQLSIVPDIWSLYEWSCWLTPTNMDELHSGKRYDTAFYICAMPKHIDAVHDQQEIVHSKWVSVPDIFLGFINEQLWLAPPQIYELSRLANFTTFDSLHKFCEGRQMHGCQRLLPVRMIFKDGICAVLPGDDLYPLDVDTEGTRPSPEIDELLSSSLARTKNIHRFEMRSLHNTTLHCSVPQNNEHARPIPVNQILSNQ